MTNKKEQDLFIQKLKKDVNEKRAKMSYKNYDGTKHGFEQDREALAQDWYKVGNYLKEAMEKFEEEELTEEQRKALREEGEER